MDLTGATLDAFNQMKANGGRTLGGRWHSLRNDTTSSCVDGHHEVCSGWIFPMGGVRECACPCHDDERPAYRVALAECVKITNWWRIGDFVTIDGSDVEWWKITFVIFRTKEVHADGPAGQTAIAGFHLLNLYQR